MTVSEEGVEVEEMEKSFCPRSKRRQRATTTTTTTMSQTSAMRASRALRFTVSEANPPILERAALSIIAFASLRGRKEGLGGAAIAS